MCPLYWKWASTSGIPVFTTQQLDKTISGFNMGLECVFRLSHINDDDILIGYWANWKGASNENTLLLIDWMSSKINIGPPFILLIIFLALV